MHSDCRAVLMVLPRTVRLKVMSAWKPALISVPIAVTSMGHCRNAEVQLQLVKSCGLELLDKKAREINKQIFCCVWISRERLTKDFVNAP